MKKVTSTKQPAAGIDGKVLEYRNKAEQSKQKMFKHFKGRLTPIQLTEWLAMANDHIAISEVLTSEERSNASGVLLNISLFIMRNLIDPNATDEEIKDGLIFGISGGDDSYDSAKEGMSSIGVAYLRTQGASSPEYVAGFMGILSLFLEILEIYKDYEMYRDWLYDAEREAEREAKTKAAA